MKLVMFVKYEKLSWCRNWFGHPYLCDPLPYQDFVSIIHVGKYYSYIIVFITEYISVIPPIETIIFIRIGNRRIRIDVMNAHHAEYLYI
jgi:hypothetical protein